MSNPCAVTVPLSRIERVQVYVNSRGRTLTQIMRETGADYGINGTLYNMRTGEINCHLKADGALLCDPGYKAWGYAWDRGEDLHLALLPQAGRRVTSPVRCWRGAGRRRAGSTTTPARAANGAGAPSASRATDWPSTAPGTAPGPPGRRRTCGATW